MGTSASNQQAALPLRSNQTLLLVSLELGYSNWLVTSLAPDSGTMSKRAVPGGDADALLELLERLRARTVERTGQAVRIVVVQEAGLDGFWIHRVLEKAGVESFLVDAASVAVPRRYRRAKTDQIDGEALIRVLAAFKRGEPRVCAMVSPPSPDEEDRRRLGRERATLLRSRIQEINRIKGLLLAQGVRNFEPLDKSRRAKLELLRTGDGRALLPHLKDEVSRALDRLELILSQFKEVEAARDAMAADAGKLAPVNLLTRLKAIGPSLANTLWTEALYRAFENRRQLAAYAGLAPTPWRSGKVDREQGISKAGNARLRSALIELAWLWTRWQPASQLSQWFAGRVAGQKGRVRKIMIVALARKLLIALWRFCREGVVPEGAILKTV
jgi:transposase